MDRPWGLTDARAATRWGELTGDEAARAFASKQHGCATVPQLLYGGLSRDAIKTRRRRGSFHALHRGVVAVGLEDVGDLGRITAAVLALGEGTVASHRPAAFLMGALDLGQGPVDVTSAGKERHDRPGISVHRCSSLLPRDLRDRQRIPHTSPARTALDITETEGAAVARTVLNHLRQQQRVSRDDFVDLYRRTPGRRGWKALLPLVRERGFSRSGSESKMKELLSLAGLPTPQRNTRVVGHELDFWWPELRINVEIDGYPWHSTRDDLNRDRDRDAHLASLGITVIRITGDQLDDEPELVIARLAAAMAIATQRLAA